MTVPSTMLFLSRKSIGSGISTYLFKAHSGRPNRRKALAPKAVPCRRSALDGMQERLESLARQLAGMELFQQPAMQGSPHDGPGLSRELRDGERTAGLDGLKEVHPGLQRAVVLLKEFARQCRPAEGVPFRCPDPARNHGLSESVAEMGPLRVAGILPPFGPAPAKASGDLGLL